MAGIKHTPGPWKYVGRAKAVRHSFAVEAGAWTFYAGSEANARLIAAAPELLEALKRLDIWAHRGHHIEISRELGDVYYQIHLAGGPLAVNNRLWEEAEAIIAKAEGL